MWIAKIKIDGAHALIGSHAKKFCISLSGYPIYSYEKNNQLYAYFALLMSGEEKNKTYFIKELKKHPRLIKVEREENLIIGQIKENAGHKSVYRYNLIHLEPVIIKEDGTEFWTLGCWSKKDLMKFVDATEKSPGAEILKVFQKKINNFAILSIQPNLTAQQKKAVEIAIKHGYYNYPRKTDVEKLAEKMNISYSTFHAHLRKAEQKLLPHHFQKMY